MPKLFSVDEVRQLTGSFTRECAQELLKQGKLSKKRMTRVDRQALQECVRKKWEQEILSRIRGGT